MMRSNNSMSYQLRGHLVKQAQGCAHNSPVTTFIARGEQQQQWQKWLLEATNPCYIGTWNIHTLHDDGNKEILLHQLRGYNWHVIGFAVTFITGKGEYDMEEGIKWICSGEEEGGEAWHGVRFLLSRKVAEALITSHVISAWIISIWLSCQDMKATFNQVYAPTADSSDDEINSFYNDLQITLNSISKKDYVIILGDFNAKIGIYLMERYRGQIWYWWL